LSALRGPECEREVSAHGERRSMLRGGRVSMNDEAQAGATQERKKLQPEEWRPPPLYRERQDASSKPATFLSVTEYPPPPLSAAPHRAFHALNCFSPPPPFVCGSPSPSVRGAVSNATRVSTGRRFPFSSV
jgi:hypothetical protein